MSVRAKMKVEELEITTDGNGGRVKLSPVTTGSAENDQFYKYTPGGCLELSTINEAAIRQFDLGKEFYVDISPAE